MLITVYFFYNYSKFEVFFTEMPLAWQARLSPKEIATFKTLYGEARLSESLHIQLFRLVIASRAPGTVSAYIASINRWTAFARKNGFT